MNRLHDLGIRAAATEVAAHCLGYRRVVGRRIARQQGIGGEHLSRRAKAALHRVAGDKRFLNGMQRPCGGVKRSSRCDPFDGGDLVSVAGVREREAGVHRVSVKQHRAGAALPAIAGQFGAGQRESVAQRGE